MGRAGWVNRAVLGMIVREAKRNGAPVLKIGDFTKGDKFKSLVFTILSARTKDETTLKACEKLFSRVRGPWELAGMKRGNVAKLIYGVGFYRQKAGYLIEMANQLVYDFDAKVPSDFEKLMKLPGVGRKTANVVLAHAFGKDAIGVDVHVHRISNRLGIVKTKKPEKTEEKLKLVVPKRLWKHLNIVLVAHGQTTCLPKVPLCSRCVIRRYCKQVGVKKSA